MTFLTYHTKELIQNKLKVCLCLLILFIYEKFVTVLRTYKLDKCLHIFWLLMKCKSALTLSFLHVFILEKNYLLIFFLLFRPQNEIFFLPHLFFLCQLSFVENIQYIYRWFPQGKQKERKEIHHHYSTSLRFKKLHKRGIY